MDRTVKGVCKVGRCEEEGMKELKLLRKVQRLLLEKMEEEQLKVVALKLKEVEEVAALKE